MTEGPHTFLHHVLGMPRVLILFALTGAPAHDRARGTVGMERGARAIRGNRADTRKDKAKALLVASRVGPVAVRRLAVRVAARRRARERGECYAKRGPQMITVALVQAFLEKF